MASKAVKLFWERGTPLAQAWLKFAPGELAQELAQIPKLAEAIGQKPVPNDPMAIAKLAQLEFANFHRRSKLELEMKESLLSDLFNGQLIATGYRQSPSISQSPVVIAAEKFENDDPNWHRETLKVHGIEYGQIRIAAPDSSLNNSQVIAHRGSKLIIEAAVQALKVSDPQFGVGNRKQDWQKVCAYLNVDSVSGNGLSFQNVCKTIVLICGTKAIKRNSN